MTIKADMTLDCRGLSCPVPVIKVAKAIKDMGSGEVIEMLGTDPGSKEDLGAWCERTGHKLLDITDDPEEGGVKRYYVRKK
jgi:tRNA 2-thiouridine synthesizing protein A